MHPWNGCTLYATAHRKNRMRIAAEFAEFKVALIASLKLRL